MKNENIKSIPMLVILSVVTCGIYYLYWLYKTTDSIKNFMNNAEINPTLELILCLFIPFYQLYWFYKYSRIIYKDMTSKVGIDNTEDASVLLLVLSFVGLGIVSAAIIQDKLNSIYSKMGTDNITSQAD
ncbi:DUF4234 domain-containing protein [Brachyspira pilosicoli]|uniref:DUF4234 domain-containing protein n=1 Tax=Brachyspira pilosicoli TaxID=52584 RepID=UPI0026669053|nr:DUF4234 domain-containing protein [Brachyspira pilosicoli]